MSVAPYPEYKDSGVEWIGEIPNAWDVLPLKRLVCSDNAGEVIDRSFWGGDAELLYTCALEPLACDFQNFPPKKRTGPNDLLLTRNGTPYVHKPIVDSIYTNVVQRITLKPDLQRDFLAIAIQNSANNLRGYGVSIESLNYEMWKALEIPLPSAFEQRAITAFLEQETGKIDALVAEQEGLIALLKEKRQAVISQAVTKGLNPNAPMKDSGIEWLGQVPAHWEVKRVKHITRSIEQGWSPQCDGFPVSSDSEWGVLKVGCVNGGRFNPEENKSLPAELTPIPELGVAAGDVLISRANTRELVGSAACVSVDHRNLLLCDKLYRLRMNDAACLPEWLAIYLRTDAARGQIELAASGASQSMVNIGQGTILDLPIPLPSTIDQRLLMNEIEARSRDLDTLTTEATQAITLLRERRAALISAAVTGKIDVRALATSQPEAA